MHKLTSTSKEAKVKANMRDLCDKHGAFYTHVPSNQFSRAGNPDYIILTQNGVTLYVECKRPYKGTQRATQIEYQRQIEARKGIYLLYNGLNDEELEGLLK